MGDACGQQVKRVPADTVTHAGFRVDFQYKSLDVTVFSDQLPYAGSRAGGRAGGRAGSELD